MLLGRTANGLYWMNRYIERAENMARLVDAGLRMALTRTQSTSEEWHSVLLSAGSEQAFAQKYKDYTVGHASDFLLRDTSNPSSVMSSIETARHNARMVRTALTRETWESINDAWMSLKRILAKPIDERDLPTVLDAIKRETAIIRGSFYGTMLRNEIFDFSQLGTYVERADNTARILDVKYYVLLPSISWVGSTLDNYQWESILRSVSAHRSYRWVYDADYKPTNIADYLILNVRMPRSLTFCYRFIAEHLKFLSDDYGERHACHQTAERTHAMLRTGSIKDIFDTGLHEFLVDFIRDNTRVGDEIAQNYRFY
ncbi:MULTISPECIES: alpha-E domain-containing protein [unclassified Mesorhizobium]|uniref:alpha-E domain-containing protein n=1 Tax=unclassified Mesorhizobium TaxID=325217 RepID=UPI0006FC2D6C|nr:MULTISPECIES: alpha-E domain-containing protein [unclassified Mesorhizobium]KQZ13585.1 A alpha-helical domain with a conserved ER moti [Mesorhizobium sp. Root1471]KQZ36096.1 A alpha-helical domain with a conserved ER moti [Mesorhizobium sp. Root554]MDR7032518.1 putative alpha-E superfamily protein [Mesorhizobium sp. BE184]